MHHPPDISTVAQNRSAIYTGWVRHRRFLPVAHSFRYRIFMMYLDLDELPTLFAGRWCWSAFQRNLAWFRRKDYLGDAQTPLKIAVRELVTKAIGQTPGGPVCLLTNMRYFGYCFNPVSFYYCFAEDGITLQAIVTDITNTPWGERHAYVLDCTSNIVSHSQLTPLKRFQFSKNFHVSPFMPMAIEYDWAFATPQITPDSRLSVHMRNLQTDQKIDRKMFDATLTLARKTINGTSLAWVLIAYPFMTLKVISAIYWQALRLWLKRVPFIAHPVITPPASQKSNAISHENPF